MLLCIQSSLALSHCSNSSPINFWSQCDGKQSTLFTWLCMTLRSHTQTKSYIPRYCNVFPSPSPRQHLDKPCLMIRYVSPKLPGNWNSMIILIMRATLQWPMESHLAVDGQSMFILSTGL
jgi:hypothetical protein